MSYGISPYDKNSYKESKKRRRQAEIADRTGKILPFGFVRRRIIIITCVALAAVITAAVFAIIITASGEQSAENQTVYDNALLLTVVNRQNPLSPDFVPQLAECDGFKVGALASDSLSQLLSHARAQGIELKIKSAYVSYDEQGKLYEQTLGEYLANPDYTSVRAEAAAQRQTPPAGCSEAQTGLLFDFEIPDEKAESFLERSCINYGFVLRYPEDKSDLTSGNASSTLYRYVGEENAVKMRSYNMCLEEYNDYLLNRAKQ